jgi:hypothetical protein
MPVTSAAMLLAEEFYLKAKDRTDDESNDWSLETD